MRFGYYFLRSYSPNSVAQRASSAKRSAPPKQLLLKVRQERMVLGERRNMVGELHRALTPTDGHDSQTLT